jgi:hypothetical protein
MRSAFAPLAVSVKIFEVLSKLKKVVTFRGKPPNSIAQNRELGGKYSDERSEKRTLSVRPD